MSTYVMMKDEKYTSVEDAAMVAEQLDLDEVDIDVYDEAGAYKRTVTVKANEGYTYTAFCIWDYQRAEDGDWYEGNEIFYDTEEAAREALEGAPAGRYTIDEVKQDASQKYDTVHRTEVVVK